MDLTRSIAVAASGLKAQAGRIRIAAENLANAQSTATFPGGEPYRRKVATLVPRLDRAAGVAGVMLGRVRGDTTPFPTRIEPGHPAADAEGVVRLPNVDPLIEAADLRVARRSYEANLGVVSAARRMIARTLDLMRV
jgi:flagellar basal-body rod protein FlgC